MKRILSLALALSLVAFAPFGALETLLHAQATVNTTTTAAAVTATATTISVASASTIAANQLIYIDRELMQVQSSYSSGTTIPVTRGVSGTVAAVHASSALVFTGPANYFSQSSATYAGPCTSSQQIALPRIVATTGSIYDCKDSIWVQYASGGLQNFSAGGTTTYTTSGAITVKAGLSLIGSAGGLTMTLAAPATYQNGMVMNIFASTAQAHTITNTAGFNGGTTARDVCTLGGAIGDGIQIQAWGGVWYVLANRNCTLG